MPPRELPAFATLARLAEARLDQLALAMAAEFRSVSAEATLAALDELGAELAKARPDSPREQAEACRRILGEREGFIGNRDDYDHSDNSMLDLVLARRTACRSCSRSSMWKWRAAPVYPWKESAYLAITSSATLGQSPRSCSTLSPVARSSTFRRECRRASCGPGLRTRPHFACCTTSPARTPREAISAGRSALRSSVFSYPRTIRPARP